jgi:3-hydroxybutyryl-CoA dehydratase
VLTATSFSPGQEVRPLTVKVSRELIAEFSEFANDRNPIHLDDEFARGRGFPGAIAHGAIAASFLLRMLTQWLGEWPLEDDELEITFISPVLVDASVTAKGVVESVDDGWLVCDVWCETQDGKKVIAGKARVAPRKS